MSCSRCKEKQAAPARRSSPDGEHAAALHPPATGIAFVDHGATPGAPECCAKPPPQARGRAALEQEATQFARDAERGAPMRLSVGAARNLSSDINPLMRATLAAGVATRGEPLPSATAARLAPGLHLDSGTVWLHRDPIAQRAADLAGAEAFTVGGHIVLGREAADPDSPRGRRTLAHELAHVGQQAGHSGSSLRPVQFSPKADVPAASPKPEPASGAVTYEVNFPDGKKTLTATEFESLKQQAIQRLRRRLQLISDLADNGRSSQIDMLKEYHGGVETLRDVIRKPKSLIGIASDIKAGVTPPYIGMWGNPKPIIAQGLAALDRGDLAAGARALQRADESYRDAMHEWNKYREATIGGAEGVASNLETVRDVSFAIALVAGAAIAAPVIATGVAAVGVTGAVATGATAIGTGVVVGTGGAVLGGGSSALGSYTATGKVDTKDAAAQAKRFGKQGLVTGLTAGLGSALGASGKAAELAKPFAQQAIRRCLIDAGVNVTGEITTQTLDAILPDKPPAAEGQGQAPQAIVPGPVRAALTGCVSGALGVPVGKLPQGATRTVVDTAVGAGTAYADARLAGQSHDDALASAVQAGGTSALISHAQAPRPRTPAKPPGLHPEPAPAPRAAQPKEATTPTQPQEGTPRPVKPAPAETAPVISKDEALARRPTEDGHEVVVTKDGVGRCSPTPCPVIHIEYKKELDANPHLKKANAEIQELRKTNPEEAATKAEALVRTLEAERANQARQAARPKSALDQDLDAAFESMTAPGLEKKGGRRYLSASEETDSARKKVPRRPKPRLDLEDLVVTPEEAKEKHPKRAAAARVRKVVGKTIAEHPMLKDHWDAAAAEVTATAPLSEKNYVEHYNKTRDKFWQRVQADPKAAAIFESAGFQFPEGKNAPLLDVKPTSQVPLEERRVSLDHIVEKASDWTLALTASNLRFELQMPNSMREIIQMRHTELRPPPP